MQTTLRKGYRPTDVRDVTSELAAFSARGMNGRASSVTDALRKELPQGRALVNVDAFFKDGQLDSTGLAEALKERDAEEQAENERATKRAEAEYEETLRVHRERQRLSGGGTNDEQPDETEFAVISEETLNDKAQPTQPVSRTSRLDALKVPTTQTKDPATSSTISMREIDDEAVDRLWDWLRRDPQPNGYFFKSQFRSSRELFEYIANALSRQVPIRAIYNKDAHVGFFALWPISTTDHTALLHIYLAPDVRGRFSAYFPYVLTGVRQIIPPTMSIVMHAETNVDAFDRLLRAYNFASHTMFVQRGVGQDSNGA